MKSITPMSVSNAAQYDLNTQYILAQKALDNPLLWRHGLVQPAAQTAVWAVFLATFDVDVFYRGIDVGTRLGNLTLSKAQTSTPTTVLIREANREVEELRRYVEETRRNRLISDDTARVALQTWANLQAATDGSLSVPNAAPGDDGHLMFAWDKGRHHLEIEFASGALPSLFYADRTDFSSSWEMELISAASTSDGRLVKTLARFQVHARPPR